MPTVHLSLPDNTYRELKKRAGDMGIQVTDLIKLYIKLGLEKGFASRGSEDQAVVMELASKIDRIEKDVRRKYMMLEGRYRHMEEMINYILERLESLEDLVSEARSVGKLIEAKRVEEA